MAVERVYRLADGGRIRPPGRRHAAGAPRGRLPRCAPPAPRAARLARLRHPEGPDEHPARRPARAWRTSCSTAVLRGLERFTGIGLVREVGEFVGAIEALTVALASRVRRRAGERCSRRRDTALLLVRRPSRGSWPRPVRSSTALGRIGLRIGGIIVNRELPRALFDDRRRPAARGRARRPRRAGCARSRRSARARRASGGHARTAACATAAPR